MGFGSFVKSAIGAVSTGGLSLAAKKLKGSGPGAIPNIGLSKEEGAAERAKDFEKGTSFGKSIIGDGSLGRLGGNTDVEAALDIRRSALGGLTGEEMQGQRDVATQGIQRGTETARRSLAAAQARAGVRGGTAGAQQMGIIGQGIDQTRQFEQGLMLQNRNAQQQAAGTLLQESGGVQKFDLGQAAREKFAQLSTGISFQQMGSAERSGQASNQANVFASEASRPSGGLLGGVLGK